MTKRKMTTEEAGEIVLAGETFTPCSNCLGVGYHWKSHPAVMGGEELQLCSFCKTKGWVVVPEYAEACRALGRPLPEYTRAWSEGLSSNRHAGAVEKIFKGLEDRVAKSKSMKNLSIADQASRTKKSR